MSSAKNNPFATERLERLLPYQPGWVGEDWSSILQRLASRDWRGAVVGPHGSGKTTFLESLAGVLRGQGIQTAPLFLNRESPSMVVSDFIKCLDHESVILFDGAEQLNWNAWRRFLRATDHARGLIITAHRPGRLPTLLASKVTPDTLRRCIEIVDNESTHRDDEIENLFHRHRGNLRHALLECYDAVSCGRGRCPGSRGPSECDKSLPRASRPGHRPG